VSHVIGIAEAATAYDISLDPVKSPDASDPIQNTPTIQTQIVFPHQDGVVQCGGLVSTCKFFYLKEVVGVNIERPFPSMSEVRLFAGFASVGHDSVLVAGGKDSDNRELQMLKVQ